MGLQEMDSLKRRRSLSGSVAHLATPAISYIYNCLRSQEPLLWGQSMQQDAESISKTVSETDRGAVSVAVEGVLELLEAFNKRSTQVPKAISCHFDEPAMSIRKPNLPTEGESTCDVVMSDDDKNEDSHQEAWTVFEKMFSHFSEVFKALGCDPHTSHCVQPEGGPPPPQEVLACLQNLSIMPSCWGRAISQDSSPDDGFGPYRSAYRMMGGFSSSTRDKAGVVPL
nr:PREDICTED: uncharacterized protein LOC102199231 [Pundamilia nyererei]